MLNPTEVRDKYQFLIKDVVDHREEFCRHPEKDFTRRSPLNLQKLMETQIEMSGSSLDAEMLKAFDFAETTPTASAFDQQRHKLLPTAYEYVFEGLNEAFPPQKTLNGFHLFACDGTYLTVPPEQEDPATLIKGPDEDNQWALYRITALNSLLDGTFTAAECQPVHGRGERDSLIEMLGTTEFPEQSVIICDRGYESWNLISLMAQKGLYFVMRIKSGNSPTGIASRLKLPETRTFDVTKTVRLTRSKAKEIRELPGYLPLKHHVRMDLLQNPGDVIILRLRFVQIVTDDGIQLLVTNLPAEAFSEADIGRIYRMRWGIETSFELLKYAIGLKAIHAKKRSFLLQEIYARLVLFNLCRLIMCCISPDAVGRKYRLRLDETVGVLLCRAFLQGHLSEEVLGVLLRRHMYSERRDHGKHSRRVRPQPPVPFRYRTV